jgi:hypothetical protein
MSDDTKAPESKDALSGLWELNREHPGAVSLALLLLYHKFMNPFLGRLPEPESEGQATLEPGKFLEDEKAPSPGDSLHLDWLSELPEIPPAPACCTEIVGAIDQLTTAIKEIEACSKPAADAPTADIHKRMDDIEREMRRATKPSPIDEILGWEKMLAGVFSDISARLLGLGATLSNLVGVWAMLQAAHLDEVFRRLAANPADLKNWSAERLEGLEELDRRYPQSKSADKAILDAFFAQAWSEWQRALRELMENIEAPDSSQQDREESLRVLPHVLEDVERALDLYRERHGGQEAPFDPELLDRAKDLLKRTPSPEPRPEAQRDDADLLSWEGGGRGRASQHDTDPLIPASYSLDDGPGRSERDRTQEQLDRVLNLVESLAARLREPVRLEVRVLDDRVIARRLDGNRSVDVDLSRGYRMVGYMSV